MPESRIFDRKLNDKKKEFYVKTKINPRCCSEDRKIR